MTRPDPRKPRDEHARAAPPTPVGDVLAGLAKRQGWSERLRGAEVFARWQEIAGPQLAAHVVPVRLLGGVLVVRAENSAWATEVSYLVADLAARANEVLGPDRVLRVTVTTGPARR